MTVPDSDDLTALRAYRDSLARACSESREHIARLQCCVDTLSDARRAEENLLKRREAAQRADIFRAVLVSNSQEVSEAARVAAQTQLEAKRAYQDWRVTHPAGGYEANEDNVENPDFAEVRELLERHEAQISRLNAARAHQAGTVSVIREANALAGADSASLDIELDHVRDNIAKIRRATEDLEAHEKRLSSLLDELASVDDRLATPRPTVTLSASRTSGQR